MSNTSLRMWSGCSFWKWRLAFSDCMSQLTLFPALTSFSWKPFQPYLEEELSAFFHDLLDLQEAGGIHEEKLVPHCHAEAACVAERQNLLEALGLHSWWELHYGWARLIAAPASTIVAAEEVPEIRTASSQHSSMGLRPKQISNPIRN